MSKMRYLVPTIVGAAALASVLSGCGSMTPGNAQPTSGGNSTAAGDQGLPSYGAPAVSSPVDTSRYDSMAGICSALNQSALSKLHISTPGQAKPATGGPQCGWQASGSDGTSPGTLERVSIIANTQDKTHSGLSGPYSKRSQLAVFQPVGEIDGLPAVIALPTDNRQSLGHCEVLVGTSNQMTFNIAANVTPGAGDPCNEAKQIAALFAQTIKGGS